MPTTGAPDTDRARARRGHRTAAGDERSRGLPRSGGRTSTASGGNGHAVDEFELIRRCFLARATRQSGTVLGIGDDAALLDTGGLSLVHAAATVAFSGDDDAAGTARRAFAAAFIRLAARAVKPRWATLGLTVDTGDPVWIDAFSAAAAAMCDACAVELIGGDTTRGPGRATVFALGTGRALPRRTGPRPPASTLGGRWPLAPERATVHAIVDLVSVCTNLAARGAEIRCDDPPETHHALGRNALELVARTNAAGRDELRAAAGRLRAEARRLEPDG